MKSDPYETLGVAPGASMDELRRALREKARLFHPDVNPAAAAYFSEVTAAYETLMTQAKRSKRVAKPSPVLPQIGQGNALTIPGSPTANKSGLSTAILTGLGLFAVVAAADRWAPYDSSVGRNRDRHTGKFRRGYLA